MRIVARTGDIHGGPSRPSQTYRQGKRRVHNGIDAHLLALARGTMSGIKTRWWVEQLIRIRLSEGCISRPAFGNKHGRVGTIREYDVMLHHFLQEIQKEDQDLLDNQKALDRYSFYCTFHKTQPPVEREQEEPDSIATPSAQ